MKARSLPHKEFVERKNVQNKKYSKPMKFPRILLNFVNLYYTDTRGTIRWAPVHHRAANDVQQLAQRTMLLTKLWTACVNACISKRMVKTQARKLSISRCCPLANAKALSSPPPEHHERSQSDSALPRAGCFQQAGQEPISKVADTTEAFAKGGRGVMEILSRNW